MKTLLRVNHYLIVAFAIMSGTFKVLGGRADIELFAKIGMTPLVVGLFGAVQLAGGLLLVPRVSRRAGAMVVLLCNGLATAGLFAAKVQPFGVISIVFVAMALAEGLTADRAPEPGLQSA